MSTDTGDLNPFQNFLFLFFKWNDIVSFFASKVFMSTLTVTTLVTMETISFVTFFLSLPSQRFRQKSK